MAEYYGDFDEDATVYIPFNTFDSNDPSASVTITNLADADIKVHKDGGTTEIATDGATIAIDFDTIAGQHLITIDTSVHADYATGSDYMVRIEGTTVDSATINAWVGTFSIENRHSATANAAIQSTVDAIPTTAMRGTDSALLAASINLTGGAVDTVTTVTNQVTAAAMADAVHDESLEDHVTEGTSGYAQMLSVYAGPHGPGIYIDSDAANTNTVKGTDGTESNPVSTFVAARTLADGIGSDTYYLETGTDLTLAATHTNWRFFGLGSPSDTLINLGSQDVGMSKFDHASLEGTQGGSDRIFAEDCVLRDPGAGSTTLHILGLRCGIFDDITLDTSNDNILIDSYSMVAGGGAPIVRASGSAGTLIMNGHLGGVDLRDLSASHNLTVNIAGGQVIFDASCNINANVELRGIGIKTDNTAGMADLNEVAFLNLVDIAISVWDRIISKANHDIGQSAGKILRQSGDLVQIDGAVSDVSPATTGFDTNLTQPDGYFEDAVMIFSNGSANVGIGLPVSTYLNASGAMTFDAPDDWPVTPVNGDDFVIYATHVHPVAQIADAVLDEVLSGHTTAGSLGKAVADTETDAAAILVDTGTSIPATIADLPTVAEFEARTPTAAQLAYIVANAARGVPVTFTTSGGSTTAAVLNLVDGAGASATDDQYNGRLLVFSNDILKDVVTDITDYDGTTKAATITAIPFAPTSTHTARLI